MGTTITITRYDIEVISQDMFGEMQRYTDTVQADDLAEITHHVYEKFGEHEYTILSTETLYY